jgi:hypothetical protein
MALYDEYPQRYRQQLHRSAWSSPGWSGQAEIHTAESMIDLAPPFTSAWNTFQYTLNRSDPGSYHRIIEPGIVLDCARLSMMTWNIAADSMNAHVVGYSFACRSVDLDPDHWWTQQAFATMGAAIRADWEAEGFDVRKSNFWASRDQVMNAGKRLACLQNHGTGQPGDRSDAFATHPQRGELSALLSNNIDNVIIIGKPKPTEPTEEEELMAIKDELLGTLGGWMKEVEERLKTYIDAKFAQQGTVMGLESNGGVYEYDNGSIFKRWVHDPEEFETLALLGVPFVGEIGDVYARARLIPASQGDVQGLVSSFSELNAMLVKVQEIRKLSLDDQEEFKVAIAAGLTEPVAA